MQRQGLLQPLLQTGGRRAVDASQLAPEFQEGRSRRHRRWPRIGLPQAPVPRLLLPFRQIGQHVLAFMPLTPLHHGDSHGLRPPGHAQPLGPIDHTEQPLIRAQAPRDQAPQQDEVGGLVLRRGLDDPQQFLFACPEDPQHEDHAVLHEGLAIEHEYNHVVRLQPARA